MKTHSIKFLKQRKFYMVLPLLAIPFIAIAFWTLGGGQALPVTEQKQPGLNYRLPDAHFDNDEQEWDKFSLYEQAAKDSLKAAELRKSDPYYDIQLLKIPTATDTSRRNYSAIDADADRITNTVAQLTRQMEQASSVESSVATTGSQRDPRQPGMAYSMTPDIDRLEELMESVSATHTEDAEMQQMNGLLEKMLDVQHPERVKEKLRIQSIQNKTSVLPVTRADGVEPVTLIRNNHHSSYADSAIQESHTMDANKFYGLDTPVSMDEDYVNAIDAVIHDTQTVVAGSVVKLRLMSPVFIQGQWLDKNQLVYGVCAVNGERLAITIQSIRYGHAVYPVALQVYDLDGIEGIYIPGAISRDAAKQATSQSIQDVQLYSMNNSLGVQAAAAGVEAAKGLFSKKVKLVKVTIKAGYQVLLRDTNTKD